MLKLAQGLVSNACSSPSELANQPPTQLIASKCVFLYHFHWLNYATTMVMPNKQKSIVLQSPHFNVPGDSHHFSREEDDEPPGSLTPPYWIYQPSTHFPHHFQYLTKSIPPPIHVLSDFGTLLAPPCTSALHLAVMHALAWNMSHHVWRCWVYLFTFFYYLCLLPLINPCYIYAILYSRLTVGMWLVPQMKWSSLGMSHTVDFHSRLPISTSRLVCWNTT